MNSRPSAGSLSQPSRRLNATGSTWAWNEPRYWLGLLRSTLQSSCFRVGMWNVNPQPNRLIPADLDPRVARVPSAYFHPLGHHGCTVTVKALYL